MMMNACLVAIVVLINAAVTVVILRAPVASRTQRMLHLGIVWLVPVFGAVLMGLFHHTIARNEAPAVTSVRDEQEYPGVNLYPPHGPSDGDAGGQSES